MLIRRKKVVVHVKCNWNLFVLDFIKPRKVMTMDYERFTHIISKQKQVRIWQRRLRYISNTRVVRASKLVDGIIIDNNAEYNSKEIFMDSNLSESDKQSIVASKNLVFLAIHANTTFDFN